LVRDCSGTSPGTADDDDLSITREAGHLVGDGINGSVHGNWGMPGSPLVCFSDVDEERATRHELGSLCRTDAGA
jgi:hypothetical protein